MNTDKNLNEDTGGGSALNVQLSAQEMALINRAMALYSRTNMCGTRDYYEEELFDSAKRKLGLVSG